MTFFEQCTQCSVIVDNGSGVFFQPMTKEYSYILTAKHNLYNDAKQGSYKEPKDKDAIKITFCGGNDKQIIDKYEHDSLDIAILKIDKMEFESPYKEFIQPNNGDVFKFYGYPQNRRRQTEQIKYFDLKVGHMSSCQIVAENESYYNQNDVAGCSGGGVFKQDRDNFYLVGIECRMDAESSSEDNNIRLRFIFIEAFDEIVEQNKSQLEPLFPPYMNDFNLLVENIFLFTGLMVEKEKITNILKSIVETYIKDTVVPKQIFDKYNIGLLTKDEYKNELTNKELWTRYLEFLVISYLIDSESITIDQIDMIYKKRKFLFAKTNNWTELVKELLSYDIKSLEKNGTVCIACDNDRTPIVCEIPSQLVRKINIIPSPKMKINQAISNPIEDLNIQHIHNFQKKILENQGNLSELGITEIQMRIIDEAKTIFKEN
ncbi:ABC-three component system protein [Aliarcobacter butzleri]|uniref:ABC-three component system protein n=1 Tax=Aliarcobacter butzleri TaxID=28197 RepID=UPI001EDBCF27|nr:ABC-three component system protein [Aliarcobacter butzleri]MCG3692498.1 hypothetical protein [Aliarcobacter butzleri]